LSVLSAASGLGKSIYLYLIAVFARHFGIPVQYIGNTGALLLEESEHKSIACQYAAMLLFMNSSILDNLAPFYSWRPRYAFLKGAPTKIVAYYALIKGDLELCSELRRKFMNMKPRNLLIIDEHNVLWQKFGSDPNSWLPFFDFYARSTWPSTWYCKFVIAGSQLYEFENKLPSGYEFSIQYVEPLSLEEFAVWERLSDYPNLKDKRNEVVDLTGLGPRMIGILINLTNAFGDFGFEEMAKIQGRYL
jgi:hypothetical protein